MKYTSTYKNIKNSSALDVDIKETFDKFEAYFDKDYSCHATVSLKGKGENVKCVEITIKTGKYTFRAESVTDSFHKSIDENFDKIKKQIRRHKDKLLSKKREKIDENALFNDVDDVEIETFELIRKKKFKVYPMTPEEASLQMELLGHNFFVFLNAETEDVNVIYKREDGGYGLIETETNN